MYKEEERKIANDILMHLKKEATMAKEYGKTKRFCSN